MKPQELSNNAFSQRGLRSVYSMFLVIFFTVSCITGCTGLGTPTAEDYYSIGMAYFEVGKYPEAEKWLNRAKSVDKTKNASEYILGRIAFETKRYDDALVYFERILAKDPENVMALKALAYTYIQIGDLNKAESLYNQVLALVPESADDGYNYALVLYVMEKYEMSEAVLSKYQFALLDNKDVLLLFARVQRAQDKPEAVDHYAQWLEANTDPVVRYEYGSVLEQAGLYARALEEYQTTLKELSANTKEPQKSSLHYAIARVLLIADAESEEGITELKSATAEGFNDTEALESLLNEAGISDTNKDGIRRIIDTINDAKQKQSATDTQTSPEGNDTETNKDKTET
jgi:tetratricopeptide (TPR) repeat protein